MKKSKLPLYVFISIIFLILVYISYGLFSFSNSNNAVQVWNTLYSRDETIVEFGDGSHVRDINPNTVLQLGESDTVFGWKVTVSNAGFISYAENVAGEYEYWFVEFSVESIASKIQYGIHPVVNTQLQYLQNDQSDYYYWLMPEEYQCAPEIEIIAKGLQPFTSFQCRFTYLVPSDERDLYWVFYDTELSPEGSYEERYLVTKYGKLKKDTKGSVKNLVLMGELVGHRGHRSSKRVTNWLRIFANFDEG